MSFLPVANINIQSCDHDNWNLYGDFGEQILFYKISLCDIVGRLI